MACFSSDRLAMNLDERYSPAGDFIIEDADHQPAGIPSLCIKVCPTFYRDWTIPVLAMPVHDMSRAVTALIGALVDLPQQLLRILRGQRQDQDRRRRARRPDACRRALAGAL